MYIDLTQSRHSGSVLYQLLASFVHPRPIALVSTVNADGVLNLAPFSFYNLLSANPPVVVFSPALNRDGGKKDTLGNIETTREFAIATVNQPMAEKMNICSVEFSPGTSEFEKSGLTPKPASKIRPALVVESPANLECTLRQILYLGEGPGAGVAVLGDIVAVHVADEVMVSGELQCDPAKLQTIGRMGSSFYTRTTDRFSLESIRNPSEYARRGPAKIED